VEEIMNYVSKRNHSVSLATIYKILEVLEHHKLVRKVYTDQDAMRYEAIMTPHHHLYSTVSDKISDLDDENLTNLIMEYLKKNPPMGFNIDGVKLQIYGCFSDEKTLANK